MVGGAGRAQTTARLVAVVACRVQVDRGCRSVARDFVVADGVRPRGAGVHVDGDGFRVDANDGVPVFAMFDEIAFAIVSRLWLLAIPAACCWA